MTFESLRRIVYNSIIKQKFTKDETRNSINRILTGVILYYTLSTFLNSDESYKGNIQQVSDSFAATFSNISENLEDQYVSYKEIKRKIISYKIPTFLSINLKQLNEIYNLYLDKQEIRVFSDTQYSQFMYNIYSISEYDDTRLEKIHYKVICPIVQYYKSYYKITNNNVNIEDVSSGDIKGKAIKLAIDNINCNKLYADIDRDTMNVKKYIYSIDLTEDNFVKIILK